MFFFWRQWFWNFIEWNIKLIIKSSKQAKADNKRICHSLLIYKNVAIYFDSVGIEYIPQEVLNRIRDKSITHNTFRIEDNESIMRGFYCIAFIEYILAGKTL